MKIYYLDIGDYDIAIIIADSEEEAKAIYLRQFPNWEGDMAVFNKEVKITHSVPIEKGIIYNAYVGE